MTKKVYVTTAEREAAQYIVKRDAARGRDTDPAIKKIAVARPCPSRGTEADLEGTQTGVGE